MTANQIDAMLAATSPAERGTKIARAGEDQWFERKGARISGQALAQAFVAFANAEGGAIVVGVHASTPRVSLTRCSCSVSSRANVFMK